MSRFVFKLPDLGEGAVDAEIVAWRVRPGDLVAEDAPLLEVTTEKASLEIPAPVAGRVVSVHGEPGERRAVGSELAVLETEPETEPETHAGAAAAEPHERRVGAVLASPATRRRAQQAGVDLARVVGSGPDGRVLTRDLDARIAGRQAGAAAAPESRRGLTGPTEEIEIKGVRRLIAERVSESARSIPHFSYVEEVDVTELERLRVHLNARRGAGTAPLTYLPFLILALVRTLAEHPQCNALYDASRGVVVRHSAVHVGVATQTPQGLKVPVVRDAGSRPLDALAVEIRRLSEAARANTASRGELTGSTITVTSLGRLGGIASTPIINAPELAIVGVNRAVERPVVREGSVAIRRMMNLSSSFDHRFVDGYEAAAMIQSLKACLEHPATIFMS
ncbi:MAG: dihydrolipoamide acetyltransferase family protein [Steroidobacteraceae bacterium]